MWRFIGEIINKFYSNLREIVIKFFSNNKVNNIPSSFATNVAPKAPTFNIIL